MRDATTIPGLGRFDDGVRHTLRALRRDPRFALISALTLALGIGANSAMFSLANALLLKPVVDADPARLVSLSAVEHGNDVPLMVPMADRIRDERVFDGMCGYLTLSVTVDLHGRVAPIQAHPLTAGCFATLGVRAAIGRVLSVEDEQPGAPHAALLAWDTWMHEYGGDPRVLDQTIDVDGASYRVVGVTERGFRGLAVGYPARLFIPFGNFAGGLQSYFPPPDLMAMSVVARLPIATTPEAMRQVVRARWPDWLASTVSPRLSGAARDAYLARQPSIESAATGVSTSVRRQFANPLIALWAISAVILLMTCVNAANLLLARAAVRRRESAVRLAIGATRGRLFGDALLESGAILLTAIGGATVLAIVVNRQLLDVFRRDAPAFDLDLAPDWRVFVLTAIVAAVVWTLSALLPAWRASRVDASALAIATPRVSGDHRRARQLAVALQVSLTILLLSTGTWFVGELRRLEDTTLGFSVDSLMAAQLSALPGGYGRDFAGAAHYRDVLSSLEGRGEVSAAALVRTPPLSPQSWKVGVAATGSDDEITVSQAFVSDRFFDTMAIPLVAGRDFSRRDTPQSPRVAILSESVARTIFGEREAVGRTIRVGAAPVNQRVEVIGIAADAVLGTPQDGSTPLVFLNFWQFGNAIQTYPTLLVRSPAGVGFGLDQLQPLIRKSGREYVSQARTLDERRRAALVKETLLAGVGVFFAGLGLTLAAVGVYGLVAFVVTARTREIAIRLSLGATRLDIVTLIGSGLAILIGTGVVIGLAASALVRGAIATALFGTSSLTLEPQLIGVGVMAGVAVIAAAIPTRRAIRVDPAQAMREP